LTEKILLILDLDETLIYATEHELFEPSDFKTDNYFIYKRPNLEEFFKNVENAYDLAIWSSGTDDYVEDIIKKIKPENIEFKFIWGRSRCTYRRDLCLNEYEYEKKLEKVKKKGYKLEKILIVDDSPQKSRDNYGNAIYVSEFTGNKKDNELKLLAEYLTTIKDSENVRKIEKRFWKELK
jgi:RNA polymerase II subunit A small phosphatase-like protein